MHHRSLRRYWVTTIILFFIALGIKLFSLNSTWVEHWYSTGIYVYISSALRVLTGWIPFSIGDLLYAAAGIWFLIKIIKLLAALFRRKITRKNFAGGLLKAINFLLLIYIVFYALWGLNYDRKGIAAQLHLKPQQETAQDLANLTNSLLLKVNTTRRGLGDSVHYESYQNVFSQSVEAYKNAHQQYPFLTYRFSSIKSSLYSTLGNYLGFSGYYNPFSGEAQVCTKMPAFSLPFITCHEMAHQLGYGTEDEANFTGYLAAKSSNDPRFLYSVYFELFNYVNGDLFLYDSLAARNNYKLLDTLVKKDIQIYRAFLLQYKNPLEPLVSALYGNYLKANNQPAGLDTYNRVVAWLIAYQKKYGKL